MNIWMLKRDVGIGSKNLKHWNIMHEFLKKNMMNGWMLKKDVRIGSKILKTLYYYYY
jgi:hypothetical protein